MTQLQAGDAVPQFSLTLDDGSVVTPASLAGRPAVLFFYPEDDSGGCTDENQEFSALASAFAERGALLIGISPDTVASHQKFRAKYELTLPLGADPERQMIEAFGLWQLKKLYGREFMGLIRTSVIVGADGRIARIVRATRIRGHAQKMLDALDEVLAKAK